MMRIGPQCIACLSIRSRVVAQLESETDGHRYRARRCTACGLVFAEQSRSLSQDQLQMIYGAEYTDHLRQAHADDDGDALLRAATSRQMELVEQYVDVGSALNVGAMGGAIKVIEDRGWALHNVEVSEYAATTARERWGLDVTVSRIEDFACAPGAYDFIKLGHVIEHLADPRFALERLRDALRIGGVILIDTDNAGGLKTQIEIAVRRLIGEELAARLVRRILRKNLHKRYGRLTPPEHLYSFTEESLVLLLRSLGFEVLRVMKPAWGDPTWFPLPHKTRFGRVERAFMSADQLASRFGRGEVLVVLARNLGPDGAMRQ